MIDTCISLQEVKELGSVRAAVAARRREAKEEAVKLVEQKLSGTVVEINLVVLSELLDLAAEAQEARERRAARSAAPKTPRASRASFPASEVDQLIAEGLSSPEIVEKLGLPRTHLGPMAARIKRYKEMHP